MASGVSSSVRSHIFRPYRGFGAIVVRSTEVIQGLMFLLFSVTTSMGSSRETCHKNRPLLEYEMILKAWTRGFQIVVRVPLVVRKVKWYAIKFIKI